MVQSTLLSICIPNFNQGTALLKSIYSLAKITKYQEIELVISDNGSTDKESQIALEYAKSLFPKVKIFTGSANKKREEEWFSGFGANLNRLIDNSVGKYIWFLGSGDLIKTEYLPKILDVLRTNSFENVVVKSEFNNSYDDYKKLQNESVDNLFLLTLSSPKNLHLYDNSISCNITHRNVYDKEFDSLKFQDSWPHIEKIVIYLSENNEFRVCSFEEALVIVDQPIDGWYVRADALKIYLELGLLYDHYLTVPQLTESRFSFEAYSNKILQVAAMIIQIRLFGRSKIEYDLARMTVKNLSRVKAMYILIALYAPVFTLRIFRSVNTILVKV
jgi:glycosyltransferase involved in cell wall biosynthesis